MLQVLLEEELSCCEAFCWQDAAYSRHVLRRKSVVNWGDWHGRYWMLRHNTGQRRHI